MIRPLRLLAAALATALAALHAADLEVHLTDAAHRPASDAVVSLTALDAPPPPAPPRPDAPTAEITQRHQEFLPFVTVVRVGSPVRFPNRDTVQHHVYSLSKPKKFEFPLYDPGQAETVVFDRAGVVTVGCNIHDWMLAYIVVLDTPWFAVAPDTGIVHLRELPAGRYRLDVWHPRLAAPVTRDLVLGPASADTPLALTLTLKPDRRIRRAPATGPAGYK